MTRRRWIYVGTEAVEVSKDYIPEPRGADGILWNDRLYQDDGDPRYSSREQHREYMRRNGLTTADDYTETWARSRAEARRALEGYDPSRRNDVAEAIHKLQARRR